MNVRQRSRETVTSYSSTATVLEGLAGRISGCRGAPTPHDDFGWQAPVNLGAGINTAAFEGGAAFFEERPRSTPAALFRE